MRFKIFPINDSSIEPVEFNTDDFAGEKTISLGRSSKALLSLKGYGWVENTVGRIHFSLVQQNDIWLAISNSQTHHLVKDTDVLDKVVLQPGEKFKFGNCFFEVIDSPIASVKDKTVFVILLLSEKGQPKKWELKPGNRFAIGKSVNSDIRIEGNFCSREHAVISASETGCIYEDTSRNGTLIGGKPIHNQSVELNPGEVIKIGNSKILYKGDSGPEGANVNKHFLPRVIAACGVIFFLIIAVFLFMPEEQQINQPGVNENDVFGPRPPDPEIMAFVENTLNLSPPEDRESDNYRMFTNLFELYTEKKDLLNQWQWELGNIKNQLCSLSLIRIVAYERMRNRLAARSSSLSTMKSEVERQEHLRDRTSLIREIDKLQSQVSVLERLAQSREKVRRAHPWPEEEDMKQFLAALSELETIQNKDLIAAYEAKIELKNARKIINDIENQLAVGIPDSTMQKTLENLLLSFSSIRENLAEHDLPLLEEIKKDHDKLQRLNTAAIEIQDWLPQLNSRREMRRFDELKNVLFNSNRQDLVSLAKQRTEYFFERVEKDVQQLRLNAKADWRIIKKVNEARTGLAQLTTNTEWIWDHRNRLTEQLRTIAGSIEEEINRRCLALRRKYNETGDQAHLREIKRITNPEPGKSRWHTWARNELGN